MSSLLDNLNKIKTKIEGTSSADTSKDNTPVPGTKKSFLNASSTSPLKTPTIKRERSALEESAGDSVGSSAKKLKVDTDADTDNESNKNSNINSSQTRGSSSGGLSSVSIGSQTGPGLSGTHLSTKLLLATEYIQNRGEAVSISQVESYLSLKPDSPEANNVIELLKNINKIKFDPEKKTLQYVSIYDIHTAEDLIKLLRKQAVFKGISVKELKDGWPKCNEVLDDLEKRGIVLVLRTKKDGTARYVWYNSYKIPEKIRANIVKSLSDDNPRPYQQFIAEDFRDMWEDVKLPSRADIPRKLTDLGLKPASVDPASVIKKGTITRVEVKKRKNRKSKITNTHMNGLLKDYSDRG